ncbi:N-acetylneuraminate lyase [Cephus cinctus]|uniref:N-acetylneuraminate lyase n=1 Tax=Cephus cinctus TaxID=211228 RepID=A0AAJ7FGA1_CEPCN|nr:N-acetylneuraminate lyase [Cephus cinctus]
MPRLPYTYRGYVVPVLTPITDDSARTLNTDVIPTYAQYLADNGVKGVLVNGTSGEGPSLSIAERKTITEAWATAVKSTKQHLMIQVGGAPLPHVLELARHAESIGVDSLLCLPELYFRPANSEQLVEYLTLVGAAAPKTPLLYYHFPMYTNVNIHMGQFLESLGDKIPSFVGIKFTSTNLEEGTQAVHADNNKYVIFLGSDQIFAGALALGIDSAIPTSVNMFPRLAMELLDAGLEGDIMKAREKQQQLSKAIQVIAIDGTWVETMKAAMKLLTPIDVGPPRPPLRPLPAKSVAAMKKGLKNLGYNV